VAGQMAAVALGRTLSASRATGLAVSITMVGVIYHLLLAPIWNPQGAAWWADQGLHTAVPLLTLLWWGGVAAKSIRIHDLPSWLAWPLGYCAYALIRGAMTGFWPYPFLDADTLGPARVSLNIAGLILAFAGLGAGFLAVARALR